MAIYDLPCLSFPLLLLLKLLRTSVGGRRCGEAYEQAARGGLVGIYQCPRELHPNIVPVPYQGLASNLKKNAPANGPVQVSDQSQGQSTLLHCSSIV
jgi:hypothetical protein